MFAAALAYLKENPVDPINVAAFEESCGVGVDVSPEQIEECVSSLLYTVVLLSFTVSS